MCSLSSVQAHDKPIKTVAVMKEGPCLLTGSSDASVKVWSVATGAPVLQATLPAPGSVSHIEVSDATIMYSVDEPSIPAASGLTDLMPCGVVHLLNPANGTTVTVKVPLHTALGVARLMTSAASVLTTRHTRTRGPSAPSSSP